MKTKNELRKELISRLAALPADVVEQASRTVAEKALLQLDWLKVETILTYEPLQGSGEIDPSYLLAKLSGKQVDFLPSTKDAPFPTKQYDVIIMPVLGFDNENHRLGRGGGWYDRFLPTQPHAITLGLAHSVSRIDLLEWNAYDYLLRIIISA